MSYMDKETRLAVHNRAKGKCEDCGTTQNLEIHHIVSWRRGGTHDLSNLKLLCHDCHRKRKIALWQSKGNFKGLRVDFLNEEYACLLVAKEKTNLNWHDFIIDLAKQKTICADFRTFKEVKA